MRYKQIQIPEFLKNCVQSFWRVEDNHGNASLKSFRIIADGCPGIIFQHAGKGTFYQGSKQLPVIFYTGLLPDPVLCIYRGSSAPSVSFSIPMR